ncbi:MAG: FHA domain-containing protein [Candidatus Sericytochromatia bacterium]|nr:FHA domain-containing protein [Candidatus Sericytochromatia bacterium]
MAERDLDSEVPHTDYVNPTKGRTAPLEISLAAPFPSDLKLVVGSEPPSVPKQERIWLEVVRGGTPGRAYPLSKEVCEIGRWDPDCDAYPEVDLSDDDTDAKVSRRHARIVKQGDVFLLIDWGSRNGTYVNGGTRLRTGTPHELKNGEEIALGNIVFTFNRAR